MNGNLIGPRNISTRKAANGIWSPNEAFSQMLTDTWPTAQDPQFANVALLTHANPALGTQSPLDYGSLGGWDAKWASQAGAGFSGRVAQCGNPPFPATPYMFFTLSNVSAIAFTRSTNFVLGTQDFTIEFWAVLPLANANIFDMRAASGSLAPTIDITSAGKVLYLINGAAIKITSSATLLINTPYHIAYTRTGSVGTLWINGVSNGTWADTSSYVATTAVYFLGSLFGAATSGAFGDELRITVGAAASGAARYTTAFTPPTARFPDW